MEGKGGRDRGRGRRLAVPVYLGKAAVAAQHHENDVGPRGGHCQTLAHLPQDLHLPAVSVAHSWRVRHLPGQGQVRSGKVRSGQVKIL